MKQAILFILFAISMTSVTAFADVKIKIRQTMSGQTFENTTYIKGKRQRSEMVNGQMVNVTQCDLRRDLQLNPTTKTYSISQYEEAAGAMATEKTKTQIPDSGSVKGGTMYITTTNRDTGERKQMFGYTARHIIRTVEMESSPNSCSRTKSKMEFDEWVIDETFGFECDRGQDYRSFDLPKYNGGCRDKIVGKTIGTAKTGYPLYQKMTFFDDSGKVQSTMLQEVLELSKGTLEAALFDIPNDYLQVKDISEIYATGNYPSVTPDGSNNDGSASSQPKTVTKSVQNVSSEVGEKKAGVIRIGLANTKVGAVGEGLSANDLSAAIRNTLAEYLKGTKIELVALEAKLPSALSEEAKEKQCDFVIFASVSHKKGGGGGFGKMLGKMSEVVSRQAIGSSDIGGQIARTTIVSAATASENVKAKDEISLDFKLHQGESTVFGKQYKAKAKSDGEDIISPMIEQVAQAILDAVGK